MYLVDISRVDEELATDSLELVGARSGHLCDDMWFSLWWRSRCACRAPRRPVVLVTSHNPNRNTCRGVSGEIRRGERFSPDRPCCVVGRRKKSDASTPRTIGVLGELRAGVPVACSQSRETGCSWGHGPPEHAACSFSRASTVTSRLVECRGWTVTHPCPSSLRYGEEDQSPKTRRTPRSGLRHG
jgi:hypothetical protein